MDLPVDLKVEPQSKIQNSGKAMAEIPWTCSTKLLWWTFQRVQLYCKSQGQHKTSIF